MSFKENLLKKIKIDEIAKQVISSIGPPDSGRRIDKKAMGDLLEMGSFRFRRERDLDLFFLEGNGGKERILVLDNDLTLYATTAEDVAMRKSPTIKEMLSIRNVIKILKDDDVVISRKAATVETIQKECIDRLDLSFKMSDIEDIENDGLISLDNADTDGVIESLTLFADILDFYPPPKHMEMVNCLILGAITYQKENEVLYGPMVIYHMIHNKLELIDDLIDSFDKKKTERMHRVAAGMENASKEGSMVFQYLKEAVFKKERFHL